MSATVTLVRHSLRRYRPFLAAVYVILIIFQVFVILAARSLEKAGRFPQLEGLLPEFLTRWTNMSVMSFRGFVLFGYSHPVVLLFLIALAIFIGTEPSAEVETKLVDLTMSRPVRRGAAVDRTVIVLLIATSGAIAGMLASTWGGLRLLAPPTARLPETRVVLALAINLGLVVIAWGAIALALASAAKRRATAAAACGLLAYSTFVLDYVGRFWSTVKGVSRISPFHYFSPFELMGGRALQTEDVAVLLGITIAATAFAQFTYARRDL